MKMNVLLVFSVIALSLNVAEARSGGFRSGGHSSSRSFSFHSRGTGSSYQSTSVHNYYRKDGTLVHAHRRSIGNSTRADNWSTRGNVNPYTGKVGTKQP